MLEQTEPPEQKGMAGTVPLVAIGSSAGGLQPLIELLRQLPDNFTPPIVWVTHLDPHHKSQLVSVLARQTPIPVSEIADGESICPHHIYIIPPNMVVGVADGRFFLGDRKFNQGVPRPIDDFFHSAANEFGKLAIAVILSGAGDDGCQGARSILTRGGHVFAQDPKQALHSSMPSSIVRDNLAGFVGQPVEIANQVRDLVGKLALLPPPGPPETLSANEAFTQILSLLRERTGIDLKDYKWSTLLRRTRRRMENLGLSQIDEYLKVLHSDAHELEQLSRDYFIHVTEFFRGPESFDSLQKIVIRALVKKSHSERTGIRVWVVGCASGEEAYSIAMLLREEVTRRRSRAKFRVFATDIDSQVLEVARQGVYAAQDLTEVPEALIERYFNKDGDRYRVRRELRDTITFALHDVTQDPPFSNIDLISCRNVFIYFGAHLQADVLRIFHRSLANNGFLFLGGAEAVHQDDAAYRVLSQEHKLYQKNAVASIRGEHALRRPYGDVLRNGSRTVQASRAMPTKAAALDQRARKALSDVYLPPSIVVDQGMNVVQLIGQCHGFLHLRDGAMSQELGRVIHEDLYVHVRSLLARMQDQGSEKEVVEDVRFMMNDRPQRYRLVGRRLMEAAMETGDLSIVSFEDAPAAENREGGETAAALVEPADKLNERLQYYQELTRELDNELVTTKVALQTTIQDLENTNAELGNANAELMALNEEFQCTSEELEVSREELESINEELKTLNEELSFKIDELSASNAELEYFLQGTNLAALLLDQRLRIFRYTPNVADLMRIMPADVGRPIGHFKTEFVGTDLTEVFSGVVKNGLMREVELHDQMGNWYLMRVIPYMNPQKDFSGLVVVFHNISVLKTAESLRKDANDRAEALLQAIPDALLLLDVDGRVVDFRQGRSSFQLFIDRLPKGKKLSELDLGNNRLPMDKLLELEALMGEVLSTGLPEQLALPAVTEDGRNVFFEIVMVRCGGRMVLMTIRDMTAHRSTEERLATAMAATERSNMSRSILLANVSHELRTPLNGIIGFSELLQMDLDEGDVEEGKKQLLYIRQSADLLLNRVNEILDIAKLEAGKLEFNPRLFVVQDMLASCVKLVKTMSDAKNIGVSLNFPRGIVHLIADEARCRQVMLNLLSNALKFTPAGGKVEVSLFDSDLGYVEMAVADNGMGISVEDRGRIFERFNTIRKPNQSEVQGTGLGLSICRRLVELQGGTIAVQCPGLENRGSCFTVRLPSQQGNPLKVVQHAGS